jgi:hypothetical protein
MERIQQGLAGTGAPGMNIVESTVVTPTDPATLHHTPGMEDGEDPAGAGRDWSSRYAGCTVESTVVTPAVPTTLHSTTCPADCRRGGWRGLERKEMGTTIFLPGSFLYLQ